MKKIIVITSIINLIIIISCNVTLSSDINENLKDTSFVIFTLFTSRPVINIEYDINATQKPFIPIEESYEIPIKVYYQIIGLFSHWHQFLYSGRNIQVSLEIIDTPDWCTASLENNTLNFNIKTDSTEPKDATISIFVDRNVPALTNGTIKIKATSTSVKGFIFTKILEGDITVDIHFIVGYIPIITVEQEFTYKEIPPLKLTTIPIKITNQGNGKTKLFIEVKNLTGKCYVDYPDSIILGSPAEGEENGATIYISVNPYKNFSIEPLIIQFTPSYYVRPDLKGKTLATTLTLKNDGSLKEENFKINLVYIIIILIAIIFVLVTVLFLKRKK